MSACGLRRGLRPVYFSVLGESVCNGSRFFEKAFERLGRELLAELVLDDLFGLLEALSFFFDGLLYDKEILWGIKDGFAPASGPGFESVNAFALVAIEPAQNGDLVHIENLADFFGGAFFGFEQHQMASFSEGV